MDSEVIQGPQSDGKGMPEKYRLSVWTNGLFCVFRLCLKLLISLKRDEFSFRTR